jgi:hypothetical protein
MTVAPYSDLQICYGLVCTLTASLWILTGTACVELGGVRLVTMVFNWRPSSDITKKSLITAPLVPAGGVGKSISASPVQASFTD